MSGSETELTSIDFSLGLVARFSLEIQRTFCRPEDGTKIAQDAVLGEQEETTESRRDG